MRGETEWVAKPLGTLTVVGALLLAPAGAGAQGIEESLQVLGTENARLYAAPVTAGLGAALNSGLFHRASVHRPLGFDVGVRAMGAFVPGADQTFVPVLPASLTYGGRTFETPYAARGELRSPTVVGSGAGFVAEPTGEFRDALLQAGEDPADFELHFPDGLDLPAVPFAVAQLSVGVPLGTEVSARFTPSVDLGGDVGTVSMIGFGARHSLDRWLALPSPLRLSVAGGWQRLEAGDYLDLEAIHAALVAGGHVSLLDLYGAFVFEDASAEVDYVLRNETGNPALPAGGTRLRFVEDGGNTWRGTAGVTLGFGVVGLNAEYSLARYPTAAAALMFGTP